MDEKDSEGLFYSLLLLLQLLLPGSLLLLLLQLYIVEYYSNELDFQNFITVLICMQNNTHT